MPAPNHTEVTTQGAGSVVGLGIQGNGCGELEMTPHVPWCAEAKAWERWEGGGKSQKVSARRPFPVAWPLFPESEGWFAVRVIPER